MHISRRKDMAAGKVWTIRGLALVAAIVIGGLIFLLLGNNPIEAYGNIISGSLGKVTALRQTIKIAVPLLGAALALAPCFKMRFWNIGAEGQITAGAIAAAFFALNFGDKLPAPVLLPVMGIAGAVFGGFWAFIPAVFNAKWGTNETLFTLMMNYIATQLVAFFCNIWDKKGSGVVGIINSSSEAGWLPVMFGQRYLLNILVVAVLVVFVYVYLSYSKHGYELSVVGESERTARYIGISVERVIVRTMLLSGALCGVAGLLLVGGTDHSISTATAGGRGFTAVMVSWLAKFNPVTMILTSFVIVFLERGSGDIVSKYGLNKSFSDILTGIILFFIIGSEFFINYRLDLVKSSGREEKQP